MGIMFFSEPQLLLNFFNFETSKIGPVRAIFVLRVENHGLSAIRKFSTKLCNLTLKCFNFVLFRARGLIFLLVVTYLSYFGPAIINT